MSAFTGFVEGFNQERDKKYAENLAAEQQNRAMADRVFTTLLNSRDPDMQRLAMQGLSAPLGRKKGLSGYFGAVDDKSRGYYDQILQRANELVPDDGPQGGGVPPQATQPQPSMGSGSAGMSTNQMTRPGSAPPQMPGQALPQEQPPSTSDFAGVDAPMPPDLQAQGPQGVAMPPPPPPVSKWKKRGTGVPTAEEIRDWTEQAGVRGRVTAARQQLEAAGATPEEIQQAIMGMLGAPQNNRTLSAVTQWGVKLPGSDTVVPVLLDQHKGYVTAGGQPLPPGAQMVRMGGGGGAGMNQTGRVPDTPEGRQALIQMGADPEEIAAGSPTGYWKFKKAANGEILAVPDMYTPPPTSSGTATILDAQGNSTVVTTPRNAPPGTVIGTAPNPQGSVGQSSAAALLADVQARIAGEEAPRLGMPGKRPIPPMRRDAIVKEAATAAGLPYQTYFELEQATRVPTARQQTPRSNAPAGPAPGNPPATEADKVREYLLQQRRGGGAPPLAPARP